MIFKNLRNYLCFDFFRFCVILCEAGKNPTVEKTFIFLIQKVYYFPMVDNTERINIKRKEKLNIF
jgi:hypothetical protein